VADGESAVERLLTKARERIAPRARASDIAAVLTSGGLVIDTRFAEQRQRDGALPGAIVVERNHLEWRLDPSSPNRIPEVTRADQRIIVVCDEGYSSSLAAASLRDLGLTNVTDLDGGYQAWRATTT
jgi:rhodanese-related sulfurtransferase